ncbi:MAG: lipase maturation factor family protein, partial [Gammaproteobacteria bacterium]
MEIKVFKTDLIREQMSNMNLFQVDDNYRLTSWLFLKGVALAYFIAFLSLGVQITGLAGPNGILPFYETLNQVFQESGWFAWWKIPTVFWLDASDTTLQLAAYGGAVLAILLFLGLWQMPALIGMFVLYVSLFHAGDTFLSFQWDTLLLETGFLAIFLVRGPTFLVIFMYHWLLFRFRFMSGFFKLHGGDPSWSELTALNYYFETQVLPHTGSWYFHQLPDWMLQGGVLLVFFTELIVPFFIFLPRPFRIAAALITIGMQILIMMTSNHNFV